MESWSSRSVGCHARVPRWLVLIGLLGSVRCSDGLQQEAGPVACADSRDNDGDGAVDCEDPECSPMAYCKKKADLGGVSDGSGDGVAVDLVPVPLDLNQTSSFGQRCQNPGGKCADGVMRCLGHGFNAFGLCTTPCTPNGSCPDGPGGTLSWCGLVDKASGNHFCVVKCPNCPYDTDCTLGLKSCY